MEYVGTNGSLFEAIIPSDMSTIARFARVAERSGYDGLILRRESKSPGETDLHAVSTATGLTIEQGKTIVATDRSQAGSEIATSRDHAAVLIGEAETPLLRHFLSGQHRLDVLRMDLTDVSSISHTTIARAADNGIFVEFDFGVLLRRTGTQRVNAIEAIQTLHRITEHSDAPYVVSATPESHVQLRGPRELTAVVEGIGLPGDMVTIGLQAWGNILARTARNRDDTFIEPGVEYYPNETDN